MKPIVRSLIAALAIGVLTALWPSMGSAQDARVAKAMAALKDQTAKLGAPKVQGNDLSSATPKSPLTWLALS
jgi:hypothetical protein